MQFLPSPMTAAQHALLRGIHRADHGLGVLLPMTGALTVTAFVRRWIEPAPRPWCRSKTGMRYRLTKAGRALMKAHESAGRRIRAIPRRRLPRA